jgi:hypothetical protein
MCWGSRALASLEIKINDGEKGSQGTVYLWHGSSDDFLGRGRSLRLLGF